LGTLRASVLAVFPAVRVSARRIDSIDLLRGIVILLMALDHTRDFFGDLSVDPMDAGKTWPALYATRWISHFCAPVFVFLAGTGAWMQREKPELSQFLIRRGLWLVVLELTWVRCFGWFFNFHYKFSVGQVIWAIGLSMCVLGVAIRIGLTPRVAAWIGTAIIFLHNLTDSWKAEQFGPLWWLWRILHDRKPMEFYPEHFFFPQYPLLPWLGVLIAGFGFGAVYQQPEARRRQLTLWLGLAATALFAALRWTNWYGDPRPWADSLYSFLNCTKYPPSLLFLLMTLGPSVILLARLPDRVAGPVVLFGRTPLFFYLIHLPMIHGAAALYALAGWGNADWLTDAPGWGRMPRPADFGFGLPGVYAIWATVMLVCYPLCRWFAEFKRKDGAPWWARYL